MAPHVIVRNDSELISYRTKRRTDKVYHSDDGYTSDPGIIREVRESTISWQCSKE